MPIENITDAEYLVHEIDEMIRELKLRRANIISRMPRKKPAKLMKEFKGPSGRIIKIKGR